MGIGRKSPLILDNLGISAVQLRQRLKGVGTEAASVADIAAVVGDIASEAMEKSGEILDENNIKVQNIENRLYFQPSCFIRIFNHSGSDRLRISCEWFEFGFGGFHSSKPTFNYWFDGVFDGVTTKSFAYAATNAYRQSIF